MVDVLRGGLRPGAFILSEADHTRSRDNLTIASGETLQPGQICAIVTATGEVKAWDADAVDGTEEAAVLPVHPYNASTAAVMGAFVTGDAEVIEDALIFPEGVSAANKAIAISQLAARGIKVRPRSYVG